jgi:DNA-binding FadR family transcriptional regulator
VSLELIHTNMAKLSSNDCYKAFHSLIRTNIDTKTNRNLMDVKWDKMLQEYSRILDYCNKISLLSYETIN